MFRELFDDAILVVDSGIRAMTGNHPSDVNLAEFPESAELSKEHRRKAAALMRINHCGEVCAQALYEGQALTSRSADVKRQLKQAAEEERKHLSLCRSRLKELDAKPSVLEPLFFAASAGIGAIAGQLGDQISLGFVEATEDEVCKHLDRHIEALGDVDPRSTAMLEAIRTDEAKHRSEARESGGHIFAKPIKSAMALAAKLMTRTTSVI